MHFEHSFLVSANGTSDVCLMMIDPSISHKQLYLTRLLIYSTNLQIKVVW